MQLISLMILLENANLILLGKKNLYSSARQVLAAKEGVSKEIDYAALCMQTKPLFFLGHTIFMQGLDLPSQKTNLLDRVI